MSDNPYQSLQSAHDKLTQEFRDLADYRELFIPSNFRSLDGAYIGKSLKWEAFAFAARGIIYGRVVLIRGVDSWINNIIVFPADDFTTPILGIEMLGFRNKIHLIVADLFPLAENDRELMREISLRYENIGEPPPMPQWAQQIFSPHPVFRKPRNEEDIETAAHAITDVGAKWLSIAHQVLPEKSFEKAQTARVARDDYVRCHAQDEPAEPFLTRAFGQEISLQLIHDFLFPSDWTKIENQIDTAL